MRKFYLSVLPVLLLSIFVNISEAQSSTTLTGGSRNLTDPLTWVGGVAGIPVPPCIGCTITINGLVMTDVPLTLQSVTITIAPGAELDINTFLTLLSSNVTLINGATVFVNDEVHLYGTSTVRLGNTGALIDGSNGGSHNSTGTLAPGNPLGAGIFYIYQPAPPVTNTTQFDIVLLQTGYGGHFTRSPVFPSAVPFPPVTPFFNPWYVINCTDGVDCFSGFIKGPTEMQQIGGVYQFADGVLPLPVVLAQFDASLNSDKSVKVNWATTEEINADYFSVQRSLDGLNWLSIGKVGAKGNSSGLVNYSFVDPSPANAINYYRLQMVDRDAKFKYSKVATVTLDGKTKSLVVYNNPFTDQIRIKVNVAKQDNLSLTLTDILGRTYSKQFFNAQPGDNMINVVPKGASAGLFILNISGKNYNQTVKLVKE